MRLAKRQLAITRMYQFGSFYRGISRGSGIPMHRRLFAVLTLSASPRQDMWSWTQHPRISPTVE